MASFGLKVWEDVFQTIPDISYFDAKNIKKLSFCKALNGRLPPEDGSVWPQTLGKRVSDDPQHFIFRRRKKCFEKNVQQKLSSEIARRKNQQIACFGGTILFWKS